MCIYIAIEQMHAETKKIEEKTELGRNAPCFLQAAILPFAILCQFFSTFNAPGNRGKLHFLDLAALFPPESISHRGGADMFSMEKYDGRTGVRCVHLKKCWLAVA